MLQIHCQRGGEYFRYSILPLCLDFVKKVVIHWEIKLMALKSRRKSKKLLVFTETISDFDSSSEFQRNGNAFALNFTSIVSILNDMEY